MDSTSTEDPVREEAFAAFVQAQENGDMDVARQILADHPGLADQVAMHYALCARVAQPWDMGNALNHPGCTLNYVGPQTTAPGDCPKVPGYDILAVLGHGGMGVVYRARQVGLKRIVALKMIRAGAHADHDQKARFRREAEAVAALDHAHIVEIYDIGEHEGCPYFSMEFVDGDSLDKHIAGNPQDPRVSAGIVAKLARALQSAHERGIIHRDLKPGNILLKKPEGTSAALAQLVPKVSDFGLAKDQSQDSSLTRAGEVVGTPSYMAPEQASGRVQDLGPLVDVYALGAILYDLLTGRPPFKGPTVPDTLIHVRELAPTPPSLLQPGVPRDLETICLKCLEKDPAKRYSSAGTLADDLDRFLNDESIHARPPGVGERALRVLLRNQFTNVTVWGWPILVNGIVLLVGNFVQAWGIAAELPPWVLLTNTGTMVVLILLAFAWPLGRCQFGPGDRQGLTLVIASVVATLLVPALYTPHQGMSLTAYRTSIYPFVALIYAIVFFVQGPLFWGGFYLCGIGMVVLALVMRFVPGWWSPLLLGVYTGVILSGQGLYLMRLGRSPDFNK